MYCIILGDKESQQAITKWHAWLHNENRRGERARLRRCDGLEEIMLQPAFYRLCREPSLRKKPVDALALAAGLLAWVENSDERPTPVLLGHPKQPGEETPLLSELRFQHLLASHTAEDLFQNLRRAIVHVGKKANPVLLADEILHWQAQQKWPDSYRGARQWQYRMASGYYEPKNAANP